MCSSPAMSGNTVPFSQSLSVALPASAMTPKPYQSLWMKNNEVWEFVSMGCTASTRRVWPLRGQAVNDTISSQCPSLSSILPLRKTEQHWSLLLEQTQALKTKSQFVYQLTDSDSTGLGWKIGLSSKFPGVATFAGQEPHFIKNTGGDFQQRREREHRYWDQI